MKSNNNHDQADLTDDDKTYLQAIAFKKIYNALYSAQDNSNRFKSDFLLGKDKLTPSELIKQIISHSQEDPTSRTAKAWSLTQKYYLDCNNVNPDLVNEILKYASDDTRYFGVKLFSPLITTPQYTKEQVEKFEYITYKKGMGIDVYLGPKKEAKRFLEEKVAREELETWQHNVASRANHG